MSVLYNLKKFPFVLFLLGTLISLIPLQVPRQGRACGAEQAPAGGVALQGPGSNQHPQLQPSPATAQGRRSSPWAHRIISQGRRLQGHTAFSSQGAVPDLFGPSPSSCYGNDNSLIKNQTLSGSRAELCGVHASPP